MEFVGCEGGFGVGNRLEPAFGVEVVGEVEVCRGAVGAVLGYVDYGLEEGGQDGGVRFAGGGEVEGEVWI